MRVGGYMTSYGRWVVSVLGVAALAMPAAAAVRANDGLVACCDEPDRWGGDDEQEERERERQEREKERQEREKAKQQPTG